MVLTMMVLAIRARLRRAGVHAGIGVRAVASRAGPSLCVGGHGGARTHARTRACTRAQACAPAAAAGGRGSM
eukprot:scaffold1360_cov251-Prasinococcus_capsulatus_cf.AAC.4